MGSPTTRGDLPRAPYDHFFAEVYDELHDMAARLMKSERSGHTLQPTALVHEAYVRFAGDDGFEWRGRPQFFAYASRCIRTILLQHERGRQAAKRGSGGQRMTLDDELLGGGGESGVDLLALDEALLALAAIESRQAEVVEMRFFGGMTTDEVAQTLGVSPGTVKNDWRFAKAWLRERLHRRS